MEISKEGNITVEAGGHVSLLRGLKVVNTKADGTVELLDADLSTAKATMLVKYKDQVLKVAQMTYVPARKAVLAEFDVNLVPGEYKYVINFGDGTQPEHDFIVTEPTQVETV